MRKDKFRAFELRKERKSYGEIRQELGVSKGTLSFWFKNVDWSKDLAAQLAEKTKLPNPEHMQRMQEARKLQLANLYAVAEEKAKEEFQYFKQFPLFTAGISIYWGEGDKLSKYSVRLANTDPLMIQLFVSFLVRFCAIERHKIKSWLLLYPDLEEQTCKKFWVEMAQLPAEGFNKSIVIKGRHKTRRTPYGVCTSGVTSSVLKLKMLLWQKLLAAELNRNAGIV